jgi:outer membrane protein assembly factor BamD (BamD/ComL family)
VIDTYPATAAAGAARVALGRLSYELDTSREALRLFDDYLRQYPNGALIEEALYYRALSLARLGHRRQAADGLRALLTSFPNSVYAAQARSQLAEGRGE